MNHRSLSAIVALTAALCAPRAKADNIYITNNSQSTTAAQIVRYNSGDGASGNTVASTLDKPYGLAMDSQGNFYTSDVSDGTILKTTPDGITTVFASGLSTPHGMAIDAFGNLFVATGTTITEVTAGGEVSTFDSGFSGVWDCAFDRNGNLYVDEFGLQKIYRYNGETGPRTLFATVTAGGAHALYNLAFNLENDLFVSRGTNDDIIEVTQDGTQSIFESSGGQVIGLAFDSSDNLYVTTGLFTVLEFTPNGTQSTFASGLNTPEGIVIPEPSGLLLLLNGAAALAFRRKRFGGA